MEEGVTFENISADLAKLISQKAGSPKTDLKSQSPLTLAFIGDAVYSLVMRNIVVNQGNMANNRLHKKTTELVSANAQAKMADLWEEKEVLTQTEADILKRGTNSHTKTQAKNASSYAYHRATGVEALAGYLYLAGRMDRLVDLILLGL